MDNKGTTRLALLNAFYETAKVMWQMTEQLTLTGEKEQAEREINEYALLVEKREPLLQNLVTLKQQAALAPVGTQAAQCEIKRREAEQLLRKVAARDKEHTAVMQKIKTSVKASLKSVSNGKKLNYVYAYPLTGESGLLDTRK